MLVKESDIGSTRYGFLVDDLWGDCEVLWKFVVNDYQGSVEFIILDTKTNTHIYYNYFYGSCSGCDTWESEGYSDEVIKNEMKKDAIYFNKDEKKELIDYLTSFYEGKKSYYGEDNEEAVEIKKVLDDIIFDHMMHSTLKGDSI